MLSNIIFVIVNFIPQVKTVEAVFEQSSERIFGIKKEVTGARKKLYNEDLHNLYFSINIIRLI
jgi:hypothetical protein